MPRFPGLKLTRYTPPVDGEQIRIVDGGPHVPDRPVIPFIEGDGIGIDIIPAMKSVINAAVRKAYSRKRELLLWEIYAGAKAMNLFREAIPEDSFRALRYFGVGIKGPLATPVGGGFRSLNVAFRKTLDLFACVRPIRWMRVSPGIHPLSCFGSKT